MELGEKAYASKGTGQEQQTPRPAVVSSFLLPAIMLMVVGWGGLALVIWLFPPNLGPRWLFFFLGTLAVTGTALPMVAFLNRRFPSLPPPSAAVITRQALWLGIYFPTLAWLQMGRVLNAAMALLIAIGLVLIEVLLRMRERSQYKPERTV